MDQLILLRRVRYYLPSINNNNGVNMDNNNNIINNHSIYTQHTNLVVPMDN